MCSPKEKERTKTFFAWLPVFAPRSGEIRWMQTVTVHQVFDDHYDNYGWMTVEFIN